MQIAFDISPLYVARAGVFHATYHLARALLAQAPAEDVLLVDYAPLHSRQSDPPEIMDLVARGGRMLRCHGLRHRRLARWDALQTSPLRPLAVGLDRSLFRPWAIAAAKTQRRRLAAALDGVDVFHSSGIMLHRQPRAANVVTIHDLSTLLFPDCHPPGVRELHQEIFRFAQEDADCVIAVSEATKRDVVDHLGIEPARVRVVHNGVAPEFRPPVGRSALARQLAPLGLEPGSYILHVGTIEPRKNLERLVMAYGALREMAPPPAPRLVLAGEPGWRARRVRQRVAALDLEGAVCFLGRVSGDVLPALYGGALFLVYPSLHEGFGLPPLEAMACGTPVIASKAASLPEVVGEAGVLVDPTDTPGLAEAMAALVENPGWRESLRAAGLARAARFTWSRAAKEMLAIYDEVAGQRAALPAV